MSYEKVAQANTGIVIGTKQTLKAMKQAKVETVVIANDAAEHITSQVRKLAEELGIPVIQVDSMKRLGEACGIDVGTATLAIKR
ncbi:LSU ribosomal protein L7AE [Terribacillus aidingensis]|jgi:large subunit ribosomal protein L7A|uniref:LSU ribosomal protein L7AE n=1 Tax=Terribacillus aidingensis TaxID=586416 RepID=A0A285P7W1_9BACI|nr:MULTISPECIES: 50S ribosomal protein L7ae-like protein [Terribacillus]QXE01848.1 50S ribosomal protein L7ae-like protein [Terribacillus sp. DMT04]SNZ17829.1 LSU ribosomal protein L7AE [Terribacillus aidingensis]